VCVYIYTYPGSTSTIYSKKQFEWLQKYLDAQPGEKDDQYLLNPKNLKAHFDIIRMISNYLSNKFIKDNNLMKINGKITSTGENFKKFYTWVHKFDLLNCYIKLRNEKFSNFNSKNLTLQEVAEKSFEEDHNKAMQQICDLNNIQQPWVDMVVHSQGSNTISPSNTPPIDEICSSNSPSRSPTRTQPR